MKTRGFLLNILLFSRLHGVIASEGQLAEVTFGGTRVTGRRNTELNIDFFGGVPFAEPPLKDLRFLPPVLKTTLNSSEFDASKPGLACLQTPSPPDGITEDCLTLNIYRPATTNNNKTLPVLFWIHGGGWVVGSGGRYNGSRLASRSIARGTPVVIITVNYRLGALGFPLGEESAADGILNLGLRDVVAALQWVKANIGAFGGDPAKVTIFGESAGAKDISLLLYNDQINDLASGAILESDAGMALMDPPLTSDIWSGFVSAVAPCSHLSSTTNTLDCLRSENVSSGDLVRAYEIANITFGGSLSFAWAPILDGDGGLVPGYTSQSVIKANFPVIVGSNLDEGTLIVSQDPTNTSSDDNIRVLIRSIFHPPSGREEDFQHIMDRVLKAYPNVPALGSPFGTGNETFGLSPDYKRAAAVLGDALSQANRRLLLEQLAQRTETQVYSFIFADTNEGVLTVPPEFNLGTPAPGSLGATHSAEISYVFGTLEDELGSNAVAKSALELSQTVMDYWISFAVTGDPNDGRGAQRPRWTPFNPGNPMVIQLKGNDTRMISDTFREEGISVFNEDPTVFRR
ncbi:hypothetical protein V5O48_012664 [Marasmius crinis-equi]|uniref:Carboxylic ester hydrolase n=1 Tax=Marasmius crinis-equi TaxID=585013 RepID=A0ABR3F263_9AGAR